jgi:hypothetical protein
MYLCVVLLSSLDLCLVVYELFVSTVSYIIFTNLHRKSQSKADRTLYQTRERDENKTIDPKAWPEVHSLSSLASSCLVLSLSCGMEEASSPPPLGEISSGPLAKARSGRDQQRYDVEV